VLLLLVLKVVHLTCIDVCSAMLDVVNDGVLWTNGNPYETPFSPLVQFKLIQDMALHSFDQARSATDSTSALWASFAVTASPFEDDEDSDEESPEVVFEFHRIQAISPAKLGVVVPAPNDDVFPPPAFLPPQWSAQGPGESVPFVRWCLIGSAFTNVIGNDAQDTFCSTHRSHSWHFAKCMHFKGAVLAWYVIAVADCFDDVLFLFLCAFVCSHRTPGCVNLSILRRTFHR